MAPWTTGYGLALEGTDGAARLQANFVGRDYFDVLGARPIIGRTFAPTITRSETMGAWSRL